ncbi:uncharacterized protein PAC_02355 [Phialocephala subalpina]|uniref:Xylanolytic transcriptional activator regulatory domain-containing protein n=1 Tax=Phialocephala subalpina TaxID=576137 RepID=A0A1L7WI80_9HELO|nr:uncharacterized protein PAC_02355 [Phialocephala subalpina]
MRARRVRRSSIQNGRALEQRLAQLEDLLRQRQKGDVVSEERTMGQPSATLSHCTQRGEKQTELYYSDGEHFMADLMDTPSSNGLSHHVGNEKDANFWSPPQMGQSMNVGDGVTGESMFGWNDCLFSFDNNIPALEIGVSLPFPAHTGTPKLAFGSPKPSNPAGILSRASFCNSIGHNRRSSILAPESTDDSCTPGLLLSICSPAGIAWVSERCVASDFGHCARMLMVDICGRQRPGPKSPEDREPEPDQATAWKYCKAYFEEALESVMGIVYRPDFEARLRVHFAHGTVANDDPGWYALRNAVYASGCRAEYSKACHSVGFEEAQERGWRYFENALSIQSQLLYGQTEITAVQALIAMCFFTEGLGNPTLEYLLCSNALLLAQAKGLHRRSVSPSNDPQEHHRNWLFWAIYCYATHLSCLWGYAPVINDDTITCGIPSVAGESGTINTQIFTHIIKLCRISSTIVRQITAMKTLSQTPEEVISVISKLHSQLTAWRDALPSSIQPDTPIDPSQLPLGYHLHHLMFLHYTYYGSVMLLHSTFAYPWNSSIDSSQNSNVSGQIATSTNIIITAARNMILATRYTNINASLPGWLLLYYPLVGFMNAFFYVIKHPNLPSTRSDIALMDMVVGHFGHLGFLSAQEMAFSFPRQIVMLASTRAKKA